MRGVNPSNEDRTCRRFGQFRCGDAGAEHRRPCEAFSIMAIMAMMEEEVEMRTVNVAKLKDQLSKYLSFAKSGEEVVIRDRNLPVAKLVPFPAEGADAEELKLVAAGKLRNAS